MRTRKLARGDVVLVRFPFSDLAGSKVRPAVIMSPRAIGQDIVVAAISSVIPKVVQPTDVILETSSPDFPGSGLRHSSVIRLHKLATIERSLVVRRLGRIASHLQDELDEKLRLSVGL